MIDPISLSIYIPYTHTLTTHIYPYNTLIPSNPPHTHTSPMYIGNILRRAGVSSGDYSKALLSFQMAVENMRVYVKKAEEDTHNLGKLMV
mgnify:CR=1 FL=1